MKQQLNIDVNQIIAQNEARFSKIKDESLRNKLMAHLESMKQVPAEKWVGEKFGESLGYVECTPVDTKQWGSKPNIKYHFTFAIDQDGKLKDTGMTVSNQYQSEVAQQLSGLVDNITSTPEQIAAKMKAQEEFNATHSLLENMVHSIQEKQMSNEQAKSIISKIEQITGMKAAGATITQKKSSAFRNIATYLAEVDKNTTYREFLQVIPNGYDDSDMIVSEHRNKTYDIDSFVFEDAELLKKMGVSRDKCVFASTVASDLESVQSHIDLGSGRVTNVRHTVARQEGPWHAGQSKTTEIQFEGNDGPNQKISIKRESEISLDFFGDEYSRSTGESQEKTSIPSNVELSVDVIKKLDEIAKAKTTQTSEADGMSM